MNIFYHSHAVTALARESTLKGRNRDPCNIASCTPRDALRVPFIFCMSFSQAKLKRDRSATDPQLMPQFSGLLA